MVPKNCLSYQLQFQFLDLIQTTEIYSKISKFCSHGIILSIDFQLMCRTRNAKNNPITFPVSL